MVTRDSLNALIGEAKNNRLWAITFIATLILPIGLIFAHYCRCGLRDHWDCIFGAFYQE